VRSSKGNKRTNGRDEPLLSIQMYSKIRDRISLCQFKPNDILVESRLAEEYGVSRTPIREALSMLKQEGMVDVLPRVGYRVVPIALQDVHEIYDLRVIMEGEACALAAMHGTEEAFSHLRETQRKRAQEAERSVGQNTAPFEYLKFHDAFHLGIAKLSGNKRLEKIVAQLLQDSMRLRMSDPLMSVNGLEGEEEDREAICVALAVHDAEHARTLMRDHITESRTRILDCLIHRTSQVKIEI